MRRQHRDGYSGVLAPNAPLRSWLSDLGLQRNEAQAEIVLKPVQMYRPEDPDQESGRS